MTASLDTSWPTYDVGPKDCIFALGVASLNYAQLEFAFSGMFSTVTGIDRNTTALLLSRIRHDVRLSLMRDKLPQHNWPPDIVDRISHFIAGFDICAANRNDLMHSNVFLTDDAIILYKTTNSGKTLSCNPTLTELRQFADDIHAFTGYGLALSNAINFNFLASGISLLWPDAPPSPNRLHYSGEPQPVRGLHQDI
jgi:hypothetical protein